MDNELHDAFIKLANLEKLQFDSSANEQLDGYVSRFFENASPEDIKTIQAHLGNAAFSIARREKSNRVGRMEIQHSIWLYHDIDDLTTPCRAAGSAILERKQQLRQTLHPVIHQALYGGDESEHGGAGEGVTH